MLEFYFDLPAFEEDHLVYQSIGIKFGKESLLYEYNAKNVVVGVTYFSNWKEMLDDHLEPVRDLVLNKRVIIAEWFNQGIIA